MKKALLFVSLMFCLGMFAAVATAGGKATLINSFGEKVVVGVGSREAQTYFGQGYVLMGADLTPGTKTEKVCDCEMLGASLDHTNLEYFWGGTVDGGKVLSASTTLNTAKTLTAKEVCESSVITVNTAATASFVAAASLDITMPATSTLFTNCLRQEGSSKSFIFVNASPTAASTTEMIAGTGCEAKIGGETGAADTVAGGASTRVTLIRARDYDGVNGTEDCMMILEELVDD